MAPEEKPLRKPRLDRAKLPRTKSMRVALGVALVMMGIFGFLPILGFWMIPLGLLVLSVDFGWARKARRRLEVWWGRWQQRWGRRKNGKAGGSE